MNVSLSARDPGRIQYFTPTWACELLLQRAFPGLATGDVLLDSTCGDGRFLVEIDPAIADEARANSGRSVVTGDIARERRKPMREACMMTVAIWPEVSGCRPTPAIARLGARCERPRGALLSMRNKAVASPPTDRAAGIGGLAGANTRRGAGMTPSTLTQAGIALFGFTAIWLTQSLDPDRRRYACIFGLLGQPFWFASAWLAGQWGIFALSFLYAWAWGRGFWMRWIRQGRHQ